LICAISSKQLISTRAATQLIIVIRAKNFIVTRITI
jgi:hypothetical protein